MTTIQSTSRLSPEERQYLKNIVLDLREEKVGRGILANELEAFINRLSALTASPAPALTLAQTYHFKAAVDWLDKNRGAPFADLAANLVEIIRELATAPDSATVALTAPSAGEKS